ncbi:MAG: NUDIX domain-containing protein [Crocinitomicaceae bacterium]|nr:NUDIX domain-containing protein [Crocinitomicaceae bacterium]
MYKVFIQNRPLHFISEGEFINNEGVFVSDKMALSNQNNVYQLLEQTPETISVFILSEQPFETMRAFFKDHHWIEAAGGIVKKADEYLFIYKNDCWDLPKGIIDAEESIEMAAIREVEEECGIHNPKILSFITNTYHTYEYEGKPVLKKTHWFEFDYQGNEPLVGQADEGITDLAWKSKEQISEIMDKTYLSIKEVLIRYLK